MADRALPRFSGRPLVKGFFEKRTSSVQYVVADPETKSCAIIDPVLDFDPKSGATATHSADALLSCVDDQGFRLQWILDTHPHADHFSAAGYLKDRTDVPTAIGEKVVEVQKLWQSIYNVSDCCPADGSQWDRLLADGERFKIGNMDVEVLFTPGHTPGVHHLPCRRRCLRQRYHLHARRRNGTRRFPGRQCSHALEEHRAHYDLA